MMNDRLRGAVGLAMKAGKCRSGDFIVERMLKRGQILLVLIDDAVSAATRERYTEACQKRDIPLLFVEDPGEAIGKPAHRILGITDSGFQKMIMNAYNASNGI